MMAYLTEEEAFERLKYAEGLCVGLLEDDELEAFNFLCEKGLANRAREGAAGFMGLAKVRLAGEPK